MGQGVVGLGRIASRYATMALISFPCGCKALPRPMRATLWPRADRHRNRVEPAGSSGRSKLFPFQWIRPNSKLTQKSSDRCRRARRSTASARTRSRWGLNCRAQKDQAGRRLGIQSPLVVGQRAERGDCPPRLGRRTSRAPHRARVRVGPRAASAARRHCRSPGAPPHGAGSPNRPGMRPALRAPTARKAAGRPPGARADQGPRRSR